jgi:hypothetical protein
MKSSGTKRKKMKGTKREHTKARSAGAYKSLYEKEKKERKRLSAGIPRFPRAAANS